MNFYRKSGLVAGSKLCCDGMKFFRDDELENVRLVEGDTSEVELQVDGVNLFALACCPWCGAAITVKDSVNSTSADSTPPVHILDDLKPNSGKTVMFYWLSVGWNKGSYEKEGNIWVFDFDGHRRHTNNSDKWRNLTPAEIDG